MDDAIKAFVMYLQVERNASQETIRNYRSDLHQLARFLQQTKKDAAPLRIDEVTRDFLLGKKTGLPPKFFWVPRT